jgi:hypothetical protein
VIRVDIDVVDSVGLVGTYGAGALIRLERSATQVGGYAEIATVPLEAGTDDYTVWDSSGEVTHWYRWRISDEDNLTQSTYSTPALGSDPESTDTERYAPLSALTGRYSQDVPADMLTRLDGALRDATQQITDLVGFDFFAHEMDDFELDDVTHRTMRGLCVHDGIVSLTALETRGSVFDSWVAADVGDYVLERPLKPGHPSFHVRTTGAGVTLFGWPTPRGTGGVRFTGVRGWPAIPRSVAAATVDRARQMVAWDAVRPGGPTGPEDLGVGVGPNRIPDTMFRLRYDYSATELGLTGCDL